MTPLLSSCSHRALRASTSPLGLLAACAFALVAMLLFTYASWRSVNSNDVDTQIFVQSGSEPGIAVVDVHFSSRWGSRVESRVVLPRDRLRIQQRTHPGYQISLQSNQTLSSRHWGLALEYYFRSRSFTDISQRSDRWVPFEPDAAYTEVLTLSGPFPLLRATSHSTISSLATRYPAFRIDDGLVVNNYRSPGRFFRLSCWVAPTGVLWPGLIASSVLWVLMFLIVHFAIRFVFVACRFASGLCPACKYPTCADTRTMGRLICTECGFET